MAFTNQKWDGSPSRWPDAKSYCDCCLIVRQHKGELTKDDCSLPVREPNGDYNTNAMSSAAGVLNGGMGGLKDVPAPEKAKAARTLKRLYAQAKMDVPDGLKGMG